MPVKEKIKNAQLVGTPIREDFNKKSSLEDTNYWNIITDFAVDILIFGGSGGAKALNIAAAQTVKDLVSKTQKIHFLHITGLRDYEEIKALYGDTPHVEIISYAEDMHALMKASHIIISRAGASSLAEIYYMAKPAIIIPFPYASGNHQYYNARIFADKGCVKLIEQSPSLAEDLDNTLREMLGNPKLLKEMTANFKNLDLPNPLKAAAKIASIAEELGGFK